MNCHDAGPILDTVHLFPGDSFSQLGALNDVLAVVGELASEGFLPVRDHAGKLVERLHSRRAEPPDTWEKILEEIVSLKGADKDLRWWARPCFDRTMRWELSELAKTAGNDLHEGVIFTSIRALQERAAKIERLDTSGAKPLPRLDLSADLPPPPDPLVGSETAQILMPGELLGLTSDSGIGKTILLCTVAQGIASGRDVMGFRCQQRPVLYVTSDGEPDLTRRLRRLWEGLTGESRIPSDLPFHALSDDAFNLDHDSDLARVRKSLENLGARQVPAIFFLESLATNVSDPNALKDQVQFRDYARRRFRVLMAEFPGLNIAVSAHLRKPQQGGANDLGTRVAGSMQIRAGLDCIIALVPSGRDAFTVRRVKRSRSGGDFEVFKVRILGARTEPLRLVNDGPTEVSVEEARGAAGAVLAFLRSAGGRKSLKDIKAAVAKYRARAVEDACKRLSEGEGPRLARVSQKPAVYELAPDQGHIDMDGLD